MPCPTTTTFDVDRMPPRLSSGYCRDVALCEAPITVCSPLPALRCEPVTPGERAAGTCAVLTQVPRGSGPVWRRSPRDAVGSTRVGHRPLGARVLRPRDRQCPSRGDRKG